MPDASWSMSQSNKAEAAISLLNRLMSHISHCRDTNPADKWNEFPNLPWQNHEWCHGKNSERKNINKKNISTSADLPNVSADLPHVEVILEGRETTAPCSLRHSNGYFSRGGRLNAPAEVSCNVSMLPVGLHVSHAVLSPNKVETQLLARSNQEKTHELQLGTVGNGVCNISSWEAKQFICHVRASESWRQRLKCLLRPCNILTSCCIPFVSGSPSENPRRTDHSLLQRHLEVVQHGSTLMLWYNLLVSYQFDRLSGKNPRNFPLFLPQWLDHGSDLTLVQCTWSPPNSTREEHRSIQCFQMMVVLSCCIPNKGHGFWELLDMGDGSIGGSLFEKTALRRLDSLHTSHAGNLFCFVSLEAFLPISPYISWSGCIWKSGTPQIHC